MDVRGFDGIPFAGAPRVARDPDVTLCMQRLTVERMDTGYRARLLDEEGNESTYRGLRGVCIQRDGEWMPLAPTGPERVWFETTRVEGRMNAVLGADRVLRVWPQDG